MDQGIRFVITGDTAGLETASKQAESALEGIARKISQLQKDIGDNIRISQGYEKAIASLTNELKSGTISQDKYAKSLSRLQRDEAETTIETNNLRKQLSALQRDQKGLLSSTGAAAKSFNNLNKSGANVVPTLTSFSQVIQDAPFGIRGVANNITQLTSQFGYLQKSTGGTVSALKAMAGGLLGPAGILFAVSAITSLLVSYDSQLKDTRSETEKLAEKNKKLYESLNNYIDALSDVRRAEIEGNRSASKQLVTVGLLREQIENTTNSQALRLDGIKRLRSEFGGYFKDISNEALLNGTASASYDLLTNSILKRAKATAATNILVKNAEKEIEVNEKLRDLKEQTAKKELELTKEQTASQKASNNVISGGAGSYAAQLTDRAKVQGEINDLLKEQNKLTDELTKIGKSNQELKATVVANEVVIPENPKVEQKADIKLKGIVSLSTEDIDKVNQELLDKQSKLLEKTFNLKENNNNALVESARKAGELILKDEDIANAKSLDATNKLITAKIQELTKKYGDLTFNIDFRGQDLSGLQAIDDYLAKMESRSKSIQRDLARIGISVDISGLNLDELNAFQDRLDGAKEGAQLFGDAIGSSFNVMANQISDSLETGSEILDSFVGTIISSLAKLLSEMIANSIARAATEKAAVGSQISTDAASATSSAIKGGAASGAATGPGAIGAIPSFITILVGVIAAAFASIGSFAQGGIVGGGKFTGDRIPIFVNSGERILTVQDQSFLTNVLRSGASATTNKNQPDMIVGEVILRGTTQVIQLRRAERKMNRFYSS